MDETTSDFFVHRYNPYIVVVLGAAILAVTVIWQLWLRQYKRVGLLAGRVDGGGLRHDGCRHSPRLHGHSLCLLGDHLCGCCDRHFVLWYLSEKTLSVHSIYTRRTAEK